MTQAAGPGELSVLAVNGWAEDARVWGDLLARLSTHYNVSHASAHSPVSYNGHDIVITSSDAAADAVRAAQDGEFNCLALLAPTVGEVLPEIDLDYGQIFEQRLSDYQWIHDVVAIADSEQRRDAVADGLITMLRAKLPEADARQLRGMFLDFAEVLMTFQRSSRPNIFVDALPTLDVPLLVIAAGEDRAAALTAQALAGRAPRGHVSLLPTDLVQYPWLARPDATEKALLEFIGECFPSRS